MSLNLARLDPLRRRKRDNRLVRPKPKPRRHRRAVQELTRRAKVALARRKERHGPRSKYRLARG